MRQLCVCQPTRNPATSRPPAIHARVLRGTTDQPYRLIVKRIPSSSMRFARSPCADIKIPRTLRIANSGQPVRVCPEQQAGQPGSKNVVMLDGVPHGASVGRYAAHHAQPCCQIAHPGAVVVQQAANHAASLLCLPERLGGPGRPGRITHQLAAMLEPAFLKPYGEQHYPRLGSVHGVWKNAQCTVNRLQDLVHTTFPHLKTLAKFPPHRATATAPASASNLAIICPPCGLIRTIWAAAANETPAAIAAIRLTSGLLVSVVRYETR